VIRVFFPGLALCLAITAAATALQGLETHLLGEAFLESLVLAILLGVAVRAAWRPPAAFQPGIHFAGHTLLEIAVVLLGAAVSARTVLALGPALIAGIAAIVLVALALGYVVGRALGLAPHLSILIAGGNAICGNSAIAAIAPVIGAAAGDVAAAIAFTAVLGVLVVLLLPFLVPLLHMTLTQYGVLAGLTVYAVPQVLAATLPIGALSNQVGTVVKLVRVLMLGPVVLVLALVAPRLTGAGKAKLPPLSQLFPWFIAGFLLLLAARSINLIPVNWLIPLKNLAATLTTVAMAALGLGVDLRAVATAGPRVTAAVTLSLLALCAMSLGLIRVLHIF
jgi:uncharacterized integral membrane protein (TIGR00698 family)